MNKIVFFFVLLLRYTQVAYPQEADSIVQIKGHISNLDKGVIYITYPYRGKGQVDSSNIVNGNFQFSGKISQPVIANLRQSNKKSDNLDAKALFVFLEPHLINVELNSDPFSTLKVEGSKIHNELLQWKALNADLKRQFSGVYEELKVEKDKNKLKILEDSIILYQSKKKQAEHDFIYNRPKSYIAPFILSLTYRNYTAAQLKEIYDNMGDKVQNSMDGISLLQHIEEMETDSLGSFARNFTGQDFINNKISDLTSLKGKYVIIDFWGSWCQPCIALLPSLVNEYNTYKDRNISFISIAYDSKANLDKCKSIVQKYEMEWTNIWQDQNMTDKSNNIAAKYNIHAYPTIIIIDPKGEIILKGEGDDGYLRGKHLLEKVL